MCCTDVELEFLIWSSITSVLKERRDTTLSTSFELKLASVSAGIESLKKKCHKHYLRTAY